MNPSTFRHGQPYTVTGSGFGSKSTAAPVLYDDFQNVTIGQNIYPNSGKWDGHQGADIAGGVYPHASANLLRSATPFDRNMRCQWPTNTGGNPDQAVSNVLKQFGTTHTTLYFDVWFYMVLESGASPENVKPWRTTIVNGVSANVANQGTGVSDCTAAQRDGVAVAVPTNPSWVGGFGSANGGGDVTQAMPGSAFYSHWIHWQWLIEAGTATAEDGTLIIYVDGVKRVARVGNISMSNTGAVGWQGLYVGNYLRDDIHGPVSAYWESSYIDSSWARVEIGDNATYASCTHREIQIPRAGEWSDTSVGFTVNRGSFAPSSTVYIFVVDSTNTVHSAGSASVGAD